jgi:hypothetical protein
VKPAKRSTGASSGRGFAQGSPEPSEDVPAKPPAARPVDTARARVGDLEHVGIADLERRQSDEGARLRVQVGARGQPDAPAQLVRRRIPGEGRGEEQDQALPPGRESPARGRPEQGVQQSGLHAAQETDRDLRVLDRGQEGHRQLAGGGPAGEDAGEGEVDRRPKVPRRERLGGETREVLRAEAFRQILDETAGRRGGGEP